MARERAPVVLNARRCTHCGRCVPACPVGAVKVGRAYLRVDFTLCDGCGACVRVCAPGAIVIASRGRTQRSAIDASPPGAPVKRPAARTRARPAGPQETPRTRSAAAARRDGAAVPATRTALRPRHATGTAVAAIAQSPAGFTWTLSEAAAMLSVTFAAFLVKELAFAGDFFRALPAEVLVPARSAVLAAYYVVQVAVLLWLIRRREGDPLSALGLRPAAGSADKRRRIAASSAALVLVGLLATRLVATLFGLLMRAFGAVPDTSVITRIFGETPIGLAVAGLMIVGLGPLVEECVFRGVLLRGLEVRIGPWPAILIQAVLFAAFHRSWWMLVPMTTLGIVLGWLAHERRSLWPAVALHAAYNGLTLLVVTLAI